MDGDVAPVLDDAFPDRAVDDVRPPGPSWNEKNRTVKVDFSDGETVYLKMAADGDGSRIARERAVIAYVGSNCEVGVPAVVASDADRTVPYLATAPMFGRELWRLWADWSVAERAAMARRVGAALASLHDRRFGEHGLVTGGDADGLRLETGPWTDVLVETIDDMRDIAVTERFEHHFDEVIAAVEANRELLDDAPAALLHGDPAQPNCFRGDDRVGFVDWELSHVGDPVREIRRTRRQQFEPLHHDGTDRIVTAFHDGYRERADGFPAGYGDRRPVYDAVTFLGTSTFFEKWAPDADEPTGDLATWVRDEMDRRLSRIT